MRLPLALVLASALPLHAQSADPLPDFPLDSAITCLAYTVSEIESDPKGDLAENRADWLVFFSGLIAAKSAPEDAGTIGERFAKELLFLRDPRFEDGVPTTRAEADEILTGTGKMCWYQALAAEGGPYFEP